MKKPTATSFLIKARERPHTEIMISSPVGFLPEIMQELRKCSDFLSKRGIEVGRGHIIYRPQKTSELMELEDPLDSA